LTEVFRQAAAIDIADDQKRRVVWRRFHERLHQQDVDNRGLVDDEQIALEGIVGAGVGTRERVGVGENVRAAYLVMFGQMRFGALVREQAIEREPTLGATRRETGRLSASAFRFDREFV
jgi:hypothetical protein